MKMDELDLSLLFDYYGDLLTEKQRICFDLYYNQDYSMGEIALDAGISRQAVYDTLARAESSLRNMEEKTGTVARDFQYRRALARIRDLAGQLAQGKDPETVRLAQSILDTAATIKE